MYGMTLFMPLMHAQPARLLPRASLSEDAFVCPLQWLVQKSAVILVGEVLAVDTASSTVTADLRVEAGFLGVKSGATFRFVQWRGGNELQLYPHERLILFLRAPNGAGVSSSIAGNFGMLRIGGGALVDVRGLAALKAQRCAFIDAAAFAEAAMPSALRRRVASGPLRSAIADRSSQGVAAAQLLGKIETLVRERIMSGPAHVR